MSGDEAAGRRGAGGGGGEPAGDGSPAGGERGGVAAGGRQTSGGGGAAGGLEAGGGASARPIRVMLVDDDPLVRSGLRMLLGGTETVEVVAEADDGEGVLAAVDRHRPDIVLMDIRMQRLDGVSATGLLARQPSPPAVLMLTTFSADELVLRAIRAGAAGFLLKDTPPAEIVRAIELVHAGDSMLSPTVARQLVDLVAAEGETGTPRADADALLATLSPRELEVARDVGRGLSNADISTELHLSVATVKAHVSKLLEKLGVENRVQVALLIRDGSPA